MVSQGERAEAITVTLSVAITHAPLNQTRVDLLGRLLRSLGPSQKYVDSSVADFSIITDNIGQGVWPTTKRAWLRGQQVGATHHLVLPDDSLACKDFLDGAKAALTAVPDNPVVFYTGGPETNEAQRRNLPWSVLQRTEIGCVGIVLPTPLIGDFLRWEWGHFRPNYKHSDVRLECWAYLTEHWIWATNPSLVEHTGEGHSLLGHNGMDRHHARRFLGEHNSALDIDWTLGLDDPPISKAALPAFHRKVLLR